MDTIVARNSALFKMGRLAAYCVPQTSGILVKQRGLEAGQRDGVTTAEAQRTKNQSPTASSNDIK